jgi:uncharacterized membrane protein YfcA
VLLHFDPAQTLLVALLFVWTGFVRSGLGFGGAALGLPLLLFVDGQPLLWLPIIGVHLLFFSGLTLGTRLHNVCTPKMPSPCSLSSTATIFCGSPTSEITTRSTPP